jgi:hypothetical protein
MSVRHITKFARILLIFLCSIALQSVTLAADAAAESAGSPKVLADIPVLPAGGPGAATNLDAKVECSKTELRKGIAKLSWRAASIPGREQRIAVTIYSFDSGQFETTGPLPSDQSSYVWDQLHGQAIHFWLVLNLHENGWLPSEIASFEGPTCVADFVPGTTGAPQ